MRTEGSSPAEESPVDAMVAEVDYPLFVVTTAADDEVSGCVAGFVTQCSIEPPRFLVCISKQNHSYLVAEKAAGLALHLLGAEQLEMASLFGELSGDVADKFSQCEWRAGVTGAPVLTDCAAWIEGRILHHFSVGDHAAFIMTTDHGESGPRSGQLTVLEAGHPATDAATEETTSRQTIGDAAHRESGSGGA